MEERALVAGTTARQAGVQQPLCCEGFVEVPSVVNDVESCVTRLQKLQAAGTASLQAGSHYGDVHLAAIFRAAAPAAAASSPPTSLVCHTSRSGISVISASSTLIASGKLQTSRSVCFVLSARTTYTAAVHHGCFPDSGCPSGATGRAAAGCIGSCTSAGRSSKACDQAAS